MIMDLHSIIVSTCHCNPLINHLSHQRLTVITAVLPSSSLPLSFSSLTFGSPRIAAKNQNPAATHAAMQIPKAYTGDRILTRTSIRGWLHLLLPPSSKSQYIGLSWRISGGTRKRWKFLRIWFEVVQRQKGESMRIRSVVVTA